MIVAIRESGKKVQRLLFTPRGTVIDYPYVKDISKEIHGINMEWPQLFAPLIIDSIARGTINENRRASD